MRDLAQLEQVRQSEADWNSEAPALASLMCNRSCRLAESL